MEWIEFDREDRSTWPEKMGCIVWCDGYWYEACFDDGLFKDVAYYQDLNDTKPKNLSNTTHYITITPPKASE